MREPATTMAGRPQTGKPKHARRWPTIVCDGWITPTIRRVLRAGDDAAGITRDLSDLRRRARRVRRARPAARWRDFYSRRQAPPRAGREKRPERTPLRAPERTEA